MKTLWIAAVCLLVGVPVTAHQGTRHDAESGWKTDARRPSRFFFAGPHGTRMRTYEMSSTRDDGWKADERRPGRFWDVAADEDGDGVSDAHDRCAGTPRGSRVDDRGCPEAVATVQKAPKPAQPAEPPKPAKKPAPREEELVKGGEVQLEDIHFDVNQATLKTESYGTLDEMGDILSRHQELRVEVGGHTDDSGAADHNLDLSQRRAETVVAYLTSKHPELRGRLTAKGYGESRPVASNETAAGRAKNRRVTFKSR